MDQSGMSVSKKNKILFVSTPDGSTKSLRNLALSLPLSELKAKLELEAGYPCNTYSLHYGQNELLVEREAIFDTVSQSGAVVRMIVKPTLEHVFHRVQENDSEGVLWACTIAEHDDPRLASDDNQNNNNDVEIIAMRQPHNLNLGKMFFAAAICAYRGYHLLLQEILQKAPVVLSSKTLNGRTLAHIAAASDHPLTLQEILLQSTKNGINNALPQDKFNRTPFDVTQEYNACLCERLIRKFKHCKRDGSILLLMEKEANQSQNPISDVLNNNQRQHKRRPKSALVKSTALRVSSVMSTASMNGPNQNSGDISFESKKVLRGKSNDELSETSGYQTQENIPQLVNEFEKNKISQFDNVHLNDRNNSPTTKMKKVKFKTRVKSAPPEMLKKRNVSQHHSIVNEDIRLTHNKCYHKKPFLAYRDVPFEELRPESVEYVALDSTNFLGMDARTRERSVMSMLSQNETSATPYSSLNNSLQDLHDEEESQTNRERNKSLNSFTEPHSHELSNTGVHYAWQQSRGNFIQNEDPRNEFKNTREQINKRFTYPKTATTKRAQSANYYEAQYHIRTAKEKYYEDIPPPRPKTANSRYRAWKPWLLEVYKEQERAKKREQQREAKTKENIAAFKQWLKQKQREEDEASSDDDSDDDNYYEGKGETFEVWLKRKKPLLDKMDKATLDRKRGFKKKNPLVNRGITVFELGSTDGAPMKIDHPDTYMYAYQKWQRRKMKYEFWKKNKGLEVEDSGEYSNQDLADQKMQLYLDGFTYNEWIGQKHRENIAACKQKKSVQFQS